jgi:ring-1,2-phenylacetyl-CoA epoxidase subunit PaaC
MDHPLADNEKQAIVERLLGMADDELVLGHRDSEWTGHAPILEEDIALANIAQDELGHAVLWYEVIQALTGQDPDQLVFFREPRDYRNLQMVELPKGDWAFTILRQFLFDAWESVLLPAWEESRLQPAADVAAKIRKEEAYHLRHMEAWTYRLGLGTDESQRRMQTALNALWPYTGQLFQPWPEKSPSQLWDQRLPEVRKLSAAWSGLVRPVLRQAGLTVPSDPPRVLNRAEHTGHLAVLLGEMQEVARLQPEASW